MTEELGLIPNATIRYENDLLDTPDTMQLGRASLAEGGRQSRHHLGAAPRFEPSDVVARALYRVGVAGTG